MAAGGCCRHLQESGVGEVGPGGAGTVTSWQANAVSFPEPCRRLNRTYSRPQHRRQVARSADGSEDQREVQTGDSKRGAKSEGKYGGYERGGVAGMCSGID